MNRFIALTLLLAAIGITGYLLKNSLTAQPALDEPTPQPTGKGVAEAAAPQVKEGAKAAAPQVSTERTDLDEVVLRQADEKTDNASLLDYLRKHSASDEDLASLARLVQLLGSQRFLLREEATKKLIALGPLALPALQETTVHPDPEVVRRGLACIKAIAPDPSDSVPMAVVRLLLQRRPPGTFTALLRYLPSASTDDLIEEVVFGLESFAATQPVQGELAAALQKPVPLRRAYAACLLGRFGSADQQVAVRKLLEDEDPLVRLRTAQGLWRARTPAAYPN
jgi:HEAT repeat protein